MRFKLSAARIDAFVNGNDPQTLAILANLIFSSFRQISETAIRQRDFFEGSQLVSRNIFEFQSFDAALNVHHLLQLIEEPRIDARQAIDFRDGPVVLERVSDVGEALRVRTR